MDKIIEGIRRSGNNEIAYINRQFEGREDIEHFIQEMKKYLDNPADYPRKIYVVPEGSRSKYSTNYGWLGLLAFCDLFTLFQKNNDEDALNKLAELSKYIYSVEETIGDVRYYEGAYHLVGYECHFPEWLADAMTTKVVSISGKLGNKPINIPKEHEDILKLFM